MIEDCTTQKWKQCSCRRLRTHGAVVLWIPAVALVALIASKNRVQADVSDPHALSAMFAEQHVGETALEVHRRAIGMAAEARFAYLSNWVLPGVDHETLRVHVAYAQTNPALPVSCDVALPSDLATRQRLGGDLVSPLLDLVDVAGELGRLDDVRRRVADWNPRSREYARLAKLASLALIDIVREDADSAQASTGQLLAASAEDFSKTGPSAGELLVLRRGLEYPPLREIIGERLTRYQAWVQADYFRRPPRRHLAAMLAHLRTLEASSHGFETVSLKPLKRWSAVSRTTAATRGSGNPVARWVYRPGYVENLVSHDDDYLHFAIPLRGNFEVECDIMGSDWRGAHLMVAGIWVAPVYTQRGFDIGNFRRQRPRVEFQPPLTKIADWLHLRIVVRDGTATTYVNGRKMHKEPLSLKHDPWIAIRSSSHHNGAVRNLRITGSPTIPEEVNLASNADLDGWLAYYRETVGGQDGRWRRVDDTIFSASRRAEPAYSAYLAYAAEQRDAQRIHADHGLTLGFHESLLRYHRPMLEDGTIEYEFYYAPGNYHLHPALDRLAFLLDPSGVRVHWVTDAEHDLTGLSSSNVQDEPGNRRGPDRLPLRSNDWNRIQLRLTGDVVTLSLNGQSIYERLLESTNQRTFGLFHFSDRTHARVRNVVWKGDWPRRLPSIAEQQLANADADFLSDDLDDLTAAFEHDFSKNGLPQDRFAVFDGDANEYVKRVPEGILATRPGTGGYRYATFAPRLKVRGDFDIVARYNRFESSPSKSGGSQVGLLTHFENVAADRCLLSRKHDQTATGVHKQVSHCSMVSYLVEGMRADYFGNEPMEERSGALRLARRGDQLYFLTAERDSPHFRLRGQRTCSTDDLQYDGVRLFALIHQSGGETSVVWKSLSVRAQELSGRAVGEFDPQLKALNEQRDQLPARFAHDFSKQPPPDELLKRWNMTRPWSADDGGFMIVAPGSETQFSSGASILKQIAGDFDLEVRFDVQLLALPVPRGQSAFYFYMQIPDQHQTQISAVFANDDNGRTTAFAQVRESRDHGSSQSRKIGSIDLTAVTALRITRREKRLTFLATCQDQQRARVIAYLDRPAPPIPPSKISFFVHTGDPDGESRVLWKSIDIRAETVEP